MEKGGVVELVKEVERDAVERTVAMGARRDSVEVVEVETLPLQDVVNKTRVVVRAAGDFNLDRVPEDDVEQQRRRQRQPYGTLARPARDRRRLDGAGVPDQMADGAGSVQPALARVDARGRARRGGQRDGHDDVGDVGSDRGAHHVRRAGADGLGRRLRRGDRVGARRQGLGSAQHSARPGGWAGPWRGQPGRGRWIRWARRLWKSSKRGGGGGANVLWKGKIVAVNRELKIGHVYGECVIRGADVGDGEDDSDGHGTAEGYDGFVRIPFKNENIAALRVAEWPPPPASTTTTSPPPGRQESVLAIVPDLVSVIDAQSREALGTPEYQYGLRVVVLGLAASERWTGSERGLQIGGPELFGITHLKW